MLISVIMASFNEEKTIKNAIESILNQTLQDFEIIVVDNGSNDSTQNIVRELIKNDPRIKLFECLIRGPAAARNMAIAKASGEYIANMDADDISDKTRLEKLFLKCHKHKKCLVGSNIEYVNELGRPVQSSSFPETNGDIRKGFKRIYNRSVMMPQTIMASRSVLNEFKYNENFAYLEDWDMVLRVADDPEVVFENHQEYLYKYKLKPMSVTFNCFQRSRYNLLIWYNQFKRSRNKKSIESLEEFNILLSHNLFWSALFYPLYASKVIQHLLWVRKIKKLLKIAKFNM